MECYKKDCVYYNEEAELNCEIADPQDGGWSNTEEAVECIQTGSSYYKTKK